MGSNWFGKALIIAGIFLVIAGCLVLFYSKIPYLGKLPGDIHIKRDNFSFFFPITTCILLSILVSLILFFFRK